MEGQIAVLLKPLANDEADNVVSRHLEFFAGDSDRLLDDIGFNDQLFSQAPFV